MLEVTRRRSRALLSLIAGLLMACSRARSVAASVGWTKPVNVGPQYSWNLGRGLAITETSSTTYLHVQFEDDGHEPHRHLLPARQRRPDRRGARRSASTRQARTPRPARSRRPASTSTSPTRPGPTPPTTTTRPPRASSACASTPTTARPSAWLTAQNFEGDTRVGRPSLAAAGSHVYVAYTDADTGDIVVADQRHNRGGAATAGIRPQAPCGARATPASPRGRAPSRATASRARRSSRRRAPTSSSRGSTATTGRSRPRSRPITATPGRTTATDLATGQAYGLSAAGDDTRLALAWAQPDGIRARVNKAGSWGPARTLAGFSSTGTYRNGYGTSIALAGTSRLGVAWSACTRASCAGSSTQGVNIRWRESANNGSSWAPAVTIASHGAGSDRRINDYPSALMPDASHRLVTYNTASRDFSTYRLVIEAGNGKP